MSTQTSYRNVVAVSAMVLAQTAFIPSVTAAQDGMLFSPLADFDTGSVQFTLPPPDAQGSSGCYIYASSLRAGLGSPNIRLDRGMLGDEQLLCFRTIGGKVAAVFENPRFQAMGDDDTQAGAQESFPFSVAAMLPIVEDRGSGGLTVDISPFLSRDAIDVSARLAREEAQYRHSAELSGIDTASLKAFPLNVEVDVIQTFVAADSAATNREIGNLATDPRLLSLVVHHSFLRLPEPGFVTRKADPRAPVSGPLIYDYGAPLGTPVATRLASRFRLEKTDPSAASSTVVEPIVFYIDPAAPEPVRTALIEGVNYWQPAFERAGFIDAFRAELLPEGADPLDARYNMVNWANRLTRGWSYGGGIHDPRTGEILKGNVVIGALRVRQDITIFEGLVGTDQTGTGGPNDPVRAALDRMRQLAAHEVGHAIGFMHNFAGSTQDRTTVMDYPAPRIGLLDGAIDLSDAYESGAGAWDDFSVDWLYGDPAPGTDPDIHAATKAVAAGEAGLAFVTDIDGRDPADPSPVGSMWDDGPDPVEALHHMLAVREVAIANFGERVLLPGEPMAVLRQKFVPIWLLHRYDVDAAGKVIGGLDYEYKVAGDNHPLPAPFPAEAQRAALDLLLATLDTDRLTVPDRLVPLLSVPITRLGDPQFDNEVFRNAGAAAFDPLVAADVAAQITLDSLLAPERLARLNEQHRRNATLPDTGEVLDALVSRVIEGRSGDVSRRIAWRAIMTMAETQMHEDTFPEVAAMLDARLEALADQLARGGEGEDGDWARYVGGLLADRGELGRLIGNEDEAPAIPPGMPIGGFGGWFDE